MLNFFRFSYCCFRLGSQSLDTVISSAAYVLRFFRGCIEQEAATAFIEGGLEMAFMLTSLTGFGLLAWKL